MASLASYKYMKNKQLEEHEAGIPILLDKLHIAI